MAIGNSETAYGNVAKIFHWATALLILTAVPLGVAASQLPFGTGEELARKALLFSLHKTIGISAFAVALLRILWAVSQPRPMPLHPERKAETLLAGIVHWSLYAAMIVVPLSGWIHHAATEGFAPILWPFGQTLPGIERSAAVAELSSATHWIFTKILAASIILHIAGALKHALIDRDGTLARMLSGSPGIAPPAKRRRSAVPAAAAALICFAGLAGAYALATQARHQDGNPQAALRAQSGTGWIVTNGTLAITVQQLGSAVTGSFGEWTANIVFDENPTNGTHGQVDVRIAIASLTLGSIMPQALSREFLAAEMFPTAAFAADILPAETGYVADGTLTLKGSEVPVALEFTLDLEGNAAAMSGKARLDRRAFGIGESYPDESSVGFTVDAAVELNATRIQ